MDFKLDVTGTNAFTYGDNTFGPCYTRCMDMLSTIVET